MTIATTSTQRAVIDAVQIAQTPVARATTPTAASNIEALPFVGEPRVQVSQPSSSIAPAAQWLLEPISHTFQDSWAAANVSNAMAVRQVAAKSLPVNIMKEHLLQDQV
jgi:hypothetical protein